MVFRYSLQFLCAPLEQLSASLAKVGRGYLQNLHDLVTDIVPMLTFSSLSKNEFCYDYIDSFARIDEPAQP